MNKNHSAACLSSDWSWLAEAVAGSTQTSHREIWNNLMNLIYGVHQTKWFLSRKEIYFRARMIQVSHRQTEFSSACVDLEWAEKDRGNHSIPTKEHILWICTNIHYGGYLSICKAGGLGSIPGLGRFREERKSYPLQYSGLENSMDQAMGSQRFRHDWATFTFKGISTHTKIFICSLLWMPFSV